MLSAAQLVAPCGINCGICLGYLRDKNKCSGCWGDDSKKPYHCTVCSIKNCEHLSATGSKFCFNCPEYPCKRMKQLNKRYQTKYNMSNLENLQNVKSLGLEAFVQNEQIKWKCNECGGMICVHRGFCLECEKKKVVKPSYYTFPRVQ
jgi:hypothetical protein